MIGITGAHRTGKTTLAKAYADAAGIPYVDASVSTICKEIGFNPMQRNPFAVRLRAQLTILERVDAIYAAHAGEQAITDRTPLDFIAYTMADVAGQSVPDGLQRDFAVYVQRCIDVTNRRFSAICLVQPGIDVVEPEAGKIVAPLNQAYIEHLNILLMGLMADDRLHPVHAWLPRQKTSLVERVAALGYLAKEVVESAHLDKIEALEDGERLQ
ncbi:AAA family ATPase [Burkholderia gladioli]|uniref:AAA family ATPase n=1 Tax=Burkholderia gladioli TaxID=28095 RepID=UPI003B50158E